MAPSSLPDLALAALRNLHPSLEDGKFPQVKRWRNILGGGDRAPEHEWSAEKAGRQTAGTGRPPTLLKTFERARGQGQKTTTRAAALS